MYFKMKTDISLSVCLFFGCGHIESSKFPPSEKLMEHSHHVQLFLPLMDSWASQILGFL